jgi:hypothetical protein
MFTSQAGPDILAALEADGWQRHATDGGRVAWTRDRLAATQAALARHGHAVALEAPAPGLRPEGLGLAR